MSLQGVEPQRGCVGVSAWVMSWSVFSEVYHISHALAWIFYAIVCGQTCASIWSAVFVVGVCTCDGVCCCVKSYSGDWPCCNHDRELLNQSGSVTGLFITSGFTDCSCLEKYWLWGLSVIHNWKPFQRKKKRVCHYHFWTKSIALNLKWLSLTADFTLATFDNVHL